MFDMEKYKYKKKVEPVCVLDVASEAYESSNSVGVWGVTTGAADPA